MKRSIVLAAGSLALVAGNASAEGCAYSQHRAAMADAAEATEQSVVEEGALSPQLLALLKKQEEEALERVVPNIPN